MGATERRHDSKRAIYGSDVQCGGICREVEQGAGHFVLKAETSCLADGGVNFACGNLPTLGLPSARTRPPPRAGSRRDSATTARADRVMQCGMRLVHFQIPARRKSDNLGHVLAAPAPRFASWASWRDSPLAFFAAMRFGLTTPSQRCPAVSLH
jgi:hypothetical protein